MSKVKIIDKKSINCIKTERNLLSKLHNDFIVNMYYAFQDYSNLYLVMDYLKGGDLRYHIEKKGNFSEQETKFIISNIILGLEYIHNNNIIHRDIKPENLIFDSFGYLRITDFGISKINENDNSNESSGTPGYMSPEVLFYQNHSFPVDFYALGIISYELCLKKRPYKGNREEIKEKMLIEQIDLLYEELPFGWNENFVNFTNLLLEIRIEERLGSKYGVKELKEHPWLYDINWDTLINKKIESPFISFILENNFDKSFCEKLDIPGRETLNRYRNYIDDNDFNNYFNGYSFINSQVEVLENRKKYLSLKDVLNYHNELKILSNSTKNSKSKIITFINGTMFSPLKKVSLSQKQSRRKVLFFNSYNINILPIRPDIIKKQTSSDNTLGFFKNIGNYRNLNLIYINSIPHKNDFKINDNSETKGKIKLRHNKIIKTVNSSLNLSLSIIKRKTKHILKKENKSSNYIMNNTSTDTYLKKKSINSKYFFNSNHKIKEYNSKYFGRVKITDLPDFKNKLNYWIKQSLFKIKNKNNLPFSSPKKMNSFSLINQIHKIKIKKKKSKKIKQNIHYNLESDEKILKNCFNRIRNQQFNLINSKIKNLTKLKLEN